MEDTGAAGLGRAHLVPVATRGCGLPDLAVQAVGVGGDVHIRHQGAELLAVVRLAGGERHRTHGPPVEGVLQCARALQ